jgi:hypothetical protein
MKPKTIFVWKMEDDLHFLKKKVDLNLFENGRRPEKLNCKKQKTKTKMVVAPLQVT